MAKTRGIRYAVRTLGGWALSRHRSFKMACRTCVGFIEQGKDAWVYEVPSDRRVQHRHARTPEGVEVVLFPDPETGDNFTVFYRGRRGRP
jgi:hypothetical protein